jgi:adenylate cyclase
VRAYQSPGTATGDIAVILLDQESLNWVSTEMGLPWPWPRELYGVVAEYCRLAGVRSLTFDVLYTEPSASGEEDDQRFAAYVRELGRVAGVLHLGTDQGEDTRWPATVAAPALRIEGLDSWAAREDPGISFPRATFPIPIYAQAVRVLGNTNLTQDADAIYRRAALFSVFDGRPVPTLGLAAFLAAEANPQSFSVRPGRLQVGPHAAPIDALGRAILRYRGPTKTHTAWRAAAVVRSALQIANGETPELDPAVLAGKYVFFGFSAPGLMDLRPTPVSTQYPGVEVHATLLDNFLSDDFLREVPGLLTAAIVLLVCLASGVLATVAHGAIANASIYVLLVPLGVGLGFAAYPLGYALPILPVTTGTLLTLVAAGAINYATEGRQRRYLKSAFRQYLSPAVIEELIAHPERLRLGGERRELSIFFSDLQGFTSLSEALSPEDLTSVLNEYLSAMTDIIQDTGGTIDKFEGDAIIAFWNAPLDQADHALRAVRSALGCQDKLAEMRPAFRERVGRDLHMRIGLNTGPAVVGNMGSKTRFDYTMLGDAVNLAARLEGVNKQFRTYTMVSAAVLEKLDGAFPARELSRIAVVGRREPVTVYEPMMPEAYAARKPLLAVFARGLEAYYAGRLAEAQQVFREIEDRDPAAAAYAERCRELAASFAADTWTGVWIMTTK